MFIVCRFKIHSTIGLFYSTLPLYCRYTVIVESGKLIDSEGVIFCSNFDVFNAKIFFENEQYIPERN